MNDPMEGFYSPSNQAVKDPDFASASAHIYNAKLNFGLCCFSDSHNSELMWAHYANNYAGICVGYRPAPLLESLSSKFHLIRMAYGSEPPTLSKQDLAPARKNEAARKILSHKKATWVYEREWRLAGPVGLHPIKSEISIRQLYLGLRIQPRYKERIMDELKDLSIKIFEMLQISDYEHRWEEKST